jgi:RNA recognition motif-containing protein
MGTRLFVGNLSYNVTELELKEAFTSEGIEVRSVRLACERETGRPRGFAFVETATDDGAKQSIEKLGGRLVQGRALIVEEAQARPAPGAPRPGGPTGAPRFGGVRPQGGPPGSGSGAPRFSGPADSSPGGQRNFGPPRPSAPGAAGPDRASGKPEGRRDRPEKKRSTRPKPEERERGNWRWKGVLDED